MTTPQLPAYSGATTCPKCTCEFIASEYLATRPQLNWGLDELSLIATAAGLGGECMLRRCHDCGWAWLEQTADGTAPATPAEFSTAGLDSDSYELNELSEAAVRILQRFPETPPNRALRTACEDAVIAVREINAGQRNAAAGNG